MQCSTPSLGDAVIEMEWYKLHATFQLDPTTTAMPRTISTITINILWSQTTAGRASPIQLITPPPPSSPRSLQGSPKVGVPLLF
jgi:hypothetical protein